MEAEITAYNDKLIVQLQSFLKPIATKTNVGFHLSIKDNYVELSTLIIWKSKKSNIESRITVKMWDINSWMNSAKDLKTCIKEVEKDIRTLKIVTKNLVAAGKLTLNPPNNITVEIDTKNRYF